MKRGRSEHHMNVLKIRNEICKIFYCPDVTLRPDKCVMSLLIEAKHRHHYNFLFEFIDDVDYEELKNEDGKPDNFKLTMRYMDSPRRQATRRLKCLLRCFNSIVSKDSLFFLKMEH